MRNFQGFRGVSNVYSNSYWVSLPVSLGLAGAIWRVRCQANFRTLTRNLQAGAGNCRLDAERGQVVLQSPQLTRGQIDDSGHTVGAWLSALCAPCFFLLAAAALCGRRLGVV